MQTLTDEQIAQLDAQNSNLPKTMTDEQMAQLESNHVSFVDSIKKAIPAAMAGAKTAVSAAVSPFSPSGNPLASKQGIGVGQGVIQGLTLGYGMPVLRAAIPNSQQVPLPTKSQEIEGALLSMPAAGAEMGGLASLAGKGAALVPALAGYAYNPSNTNIEPALSLKRALGGALGAAGQGVGGVAQAIDGRINTESVKALTKALKPVKWNKNCQDDAAIALPIIQETGKNVETLEDFNNAATQAKSNVWDKIQELLDKAHSKIQYVNPVSDATKAIPSKNYIGGNAILQKMKSSIAPESKKLTPEVSDAIDAAAAKYHNKRITILEAEDRLKRLNADLTSYFKASNRTGYVKGMNEDIGAMLAERISLKNSLYSKIQLLTGEKIAPLKKQYGALMNLQDEALGRVNVADRQSPVSLQEALNGIPGMVELFSGNPLGLVRLVGSQAIKYMNKTDTLVSNAVKNVGREAPALSPYAVGTTIPLQGAAQTQGLEKNPLNIQDNQ